MEHDRFLFDADQQAEADALRRAEEDIGAGRTVPHEQVAKWLKTWGKPGEQPMPREWRR